MRFEGRTAIVTGAARGIGRAIATRLAGEGARVMIADVDEATATGTAAEIGERALPHRLDVTSPESWTAAVERATGEWGRLDILVNNAGIAGRSAPTWELSVEEWREVLDVDLTGVFLGCRAALGPMLAAGAGRGAGVGAPGGRGFKAPGHGDDAPSRGLAVGRPGAERGTGAKAPDRRKKPAKADCERVVVLLSRERVAL